MKGRLRTKSKIMIAVLITVYVLFVLLFTGILLEGLGTSVGVWLNRPSVDAYMSRHYGDVGYKVIDGKYVSETEQYLGFEITKSGYCYECRVESVKNGEYGTLKAGDIFKIKSFNFTVYYDEIFSVCNCDLELAEGINSYLLGLTENFFSEGAYGFKPFDLYADTMPRAGQFGGGTLSERVDQAVDSGIVGSGDIVLYVRGENVDFDSYKNIISGIVAFYAEGAPGADKKLVPSNLQIFYYYTDGDGKDVALYESEFTAAELKFTKSMAAAANDIHYKMIPTDDEAAKAKAYGIVRIVYIVLILCVIFGLSGLWIVRKIIKTVRQDRALLYADPDDPASAVIGDGDSGCDVPEADREADGSKDAAYSVTEDTADGTETDPREKA